MEEQTNVPQFTKTKLAGRYFTDHLNDTLANVLIPASITLFIIGLLPIIYGFFVGLYYLFLFVFSAILVLATVGLIFLNQNNILVKLWSVEPNMDAAINASRIGTPIMLGVCGAILVVVLILTIVSWKYTNRRGKYIGILIVCGLIFLWSFAFAFVPVTAR